MDLNKNSPGETIWKSAHDLRVQGDFDLSIELLKDLINSPSSRNNPILKINAMNELIICHRAFDDYEEAMELSIQVISLCIEHRYEIGKAESFISLGSLSHLSGSLNQAKDFFRSSLLIGEKTNQNLLVSRSLIHIGLIARDEGYIEKAEGNFYSAFKLLEQNSSNNESFNLSINALNHLGLTKLIQLKFSETIELFNQALNLIKENFNYSKKSLILRNLSLCYHLLDNEQYRKNIEESISESSKRHKLQSNDYILSNIFNIIYLFEDYKYENALQNIKDIQSIMFDKSYTYLFFVIFVKIMIYNEQQIIEIEKTLSTAEDYYRTNKEFINRNRNQKLFLLQIEFFRILKDQTTASIRNYSFGISRKYENLIRLARGHKESRIYLISYTYLLELLIPHVQDNEIQITEINKESVLNLLKQFKFDLKNQNQLIYAYFEILEVLIHLFYTMEFNSNIQKLIEIKSIFSKNKLTERELYIFKLESEFTEKLSKLAEVSEGKKINVVKELIISYQKELREKITRELRYFRFKVIEILYLLNTFAYN